MDGCDIKKLILFGPAILVFILGIYLYYGVTKENSFLNLKYVVTETKGPDSFDPKDADKTQNLSAMRMLYATPLEIDKNNLLQSYVLKSFRYDEQKSLIIFEIKEGLKYSDGGNILIRDVALAIARTAYFHPDFPVVKNIKGVKTWVDSKKGLTTFPSGMKVRGNTLTIEFDRKMANPLFRFCLELFSIIPESCLNLNTAAMTCRTAPSSGYFMMEAQNEKEITFQKRKDIEPPFDEIPFEKIIFQFKTLSEACSNLIEPNQVISGSEIDFVAAGCSKSIQKNQVHWMPSARFLVLRFNPHENIFNLKENRQFFAEKVREILRAKNSELIVERGLFPKLLPGYLDSESLQRTDIDRSKAFKGIRIQLPDIKSFGALIFESIIEAAKNLQMKVVVISEPPMNQVIDSFLNGTFPVIAGSSGFWAQDPIGDVSMWFTKNLHKPMKFIWEDDEVYRQIHALEIETEPNLIKMKMEALNKYVSDQAVIAPVLHFRRLFISSREVTGLNLPQAITSPAPWQLIVIQ